jgi:hypothetical protein
VKKNTIMKGVLLLIVLAVLSMGFTGCGTTTIITTIPTTGTVYIIVYGWDFYDLYMDYALKYWGATSGTYVLNNVPIGSHFFEAEDTWGWSWGYDFTTQYIYSGVNYVYLYPY